MAYNSLRFSMRPPALVCAIVCALTPSVGLLAHQAAANTGVMPRFEVGSVRGGSPTRFGLPIIRVLPGGHLRATATLRDLVVAAWELQSYQRVDGAFPVLDRWFEIDAKAPEGTAGRSAALQMLQVLLEDRFKLRVRFDEEVRTVSVLRLAQPGVLGPALRRARVPCVHGRGQAAASPATEQPSLCTIGATNGRLRAAIAQMSEFASFLSMASKQPVVDETGLAGAFEFEMAYDPRSLQPPTINPVPAGLPVFPDALRTQLGMTFEAQRRPVAALAIEHAEPPTAN